MENYSTEVWRNHSRSSYMMMIHTHSRPEEDRNANESHKHITELPMVKLKFKVLLLLHEGENEISFDFLGVKDTLRIFYKKVRREYFVRFVERQIIFLTFSNIINYGCISQNAFLTLESQTLRRVLSSMCRHISMF